VFYSQVAKSTTYCYSSLPPKHGNIRLLRLIPNKNATAGIKCQLFNYSLESGQGNHVYEALSYVWGVSPETVPITIDGQSFDVKRNLHSALLRLRNHSMDRILWIDAICINQGNQEEKEDQIQFMARIYSEAECVVVWLGEDADDSNQALGDICTAAEEESMDVMHNNQKVITLLQRPWFERIWVS
jgi:hypothetical protein